MPHVDIPVRHDRWEWLAAFLSNWHPSSASKRQGLSARRLEAAAGRLGVKLPSALREWYGLFGAKFDYWSSQDQFLAPEQLQYRGGYLVLYIENQGLAQWGFSLESIAHEDPPVCINIGDLDSDWKEESPSISQFALDMAIYAAKFVAPYVVSGSVESARVASFVNNNPFYAFNHAWHWPKFPTRLYFDTDLIFEVQGESDQCPWISLSAVTRDKFEFALSMCNGYGIEFSSLSRLDLER